MKELSEPEVLRRAAAYCSTVERCASDVEKKLLDWMVAPDVIRRVLDRLKKEDFVNEERFCRSFTNDKFRFNQWGKSKIEYELRRKQLPLDIIKAALNNLDCEAYEGTLDKLLKERKKSTKGKDERDCYQKLFRFAYGRGFESALISRTLKRIFNGLEEDTDSFE